MYFNYISLLHKAIEKRNIQIVNLLLTASSINTNENKVTYTTQRNDRPPPNYNPPKEKIVLKNALILAIENDSPEIVESILKMPEVDVNYMVRNSETGEEKSILCIAIERENTEIVKLLLNFTGIDVNIKSYTNQFNNYREVTPLLIAVEKSNIDIVQLILSNQTVDVNQKNVFKSENNYIENEKTALHVAVENNNKEIVSLLLKSSRIDPNIFASSKDYSLDTIAIKIT